MDTVEVCAARGAALLDKLEPSWHERVSVTGLSMVSCGMCVLGQVYGEYGTGLYALFGKYDTDNSDHYGFSAFVTGGPQTDALTASGQTVWAALGHAWRDEIARRRVQQRPVTLLPLFVSQVTRDEVALSA